MEPDRRGFSLWIDQKNYLLLKATSDLAWHAIVPHEGKPSTLFRFTIQMTEQYRNTVQNPTFNDAVFRFIPPKGAEETYIERRGQ